MNSGEGKEKRPTLPTSTTTTLQRSSRFRNLFDQLALIANEQRIATEALVSIASGARVEYLSAETRANKTFLQDTNKITFNEEDMEVGFSNHKKPLYLAAYINQILIKRALVDTCTSVNLIPLSTLQAARISEGKI